MPIVLPLRTPSLTAGIGTVAASIDESSRPTAVAVEPNLVDSQHGMHIPELDGVRGLAILMVTLYRFGKETPTDSTTAHLLHLGFSIGERGVELFFVLSGFLITGILLHSKGRPHYFRNFFARRSLRIFPLYFGSLFLLLTVGGNLPALRSMFAEANENQLYLWTYLVNVKMSVANQWCFGYLDHFWSLAVEEHFYLLWPAIIFFVPNRSILAVTVGLALTSLVARVSFVLLSTNDVAPDVLSVFRFDALLIGSALAILWRSEHRLDSLKKWLPVSAFICLSVILCCLILHKRLLSLPLSVWPLLWSCLLVLLLTATRRSLIAKFFNLAALRTLGKYSYAMYVFQNPLIPLTSGVISVATIRPWLGNEWAAHLCYVGLMCMMTYAAALMSWHLLEQPCLRLKAYFPLVDGSRAREKILAEQ